MLINDYTSVPSWQACRECHILLRSILLCFPLHSATFYRLVVTYIVSTLRVGLPPSSLLQSVVSKPHTFNAWSNTDKPSWILHINPTWISKLILQI
jgi:hypothetical protein